MLNYAYAVLIAQTQIRLIVEGYDPTIGIMHEKKALRGINPGFALDHMEPMRPVVDRTVLQLIDIVTFTGADFLIQHDGVCRMNPELARRVAQLALERCGAQPFYDFTLANALPPAAFGRNSVIRSSASTRKRARTHSRSRPRGFGVG